jgi:hypothetical protein
MPPIPQIGSFTASAEHRAPRLHVDLEGLQGVDQGQRIGALRLADARQLHDVRDVRRQLHEQRQGGRAPGRAHQPREQARVLAELDAPALHVRTRGVDLDARHTARPGQALAHLRVAIDLGLEHARDDEHPLRQRGKLFAHEGVHPDVLETDRAARA